MVEEAHRLGSEVTASACVSLTASPWWHRGLAYDNPMFDGRTCVEYHADGSRNDIRDNPKKVAAFLNPAREDNRAYALAVLREIVKNYDIDGLALDYCRYPDAESDFSEDTRIAFEKYLGKKLKKIPLTTSSPTMPTAAASPENTIRNGGRSAPVSFRFHTLCP